MEYSQIKELITTVDKSSITDFKMKISGDISIKMSKRCSMKAAAPNAAAVVEKKDIKPEEEISEPITLMPVDKVELKEGSIVNSPVVGTFYATSSPDAPPYVKTGDKVKKGDILCIIEAMKIMNEITSEYDGEVAEIMVENGDMVEYGQSLFRII